MATHFTLSNPRATTRTAILLSHRHKLIIPNFLSTEVTRCFIKYTADSKNGILRISRIKAANGGGESYLDMWKKAMERERKAGELERMAGKSSGKEEGGAGDELERRNSDFNQLLEVSTAERDRVQRMQVIDRAAAAISAARALIKENLLPQEVKDVENPQEGVQNGGSLLPLSRSIDVGTPGPSFWTWEPPLDDDDSFGGSEMKPARQTSVSPGQMLSLLEKERSSGFFSIPFESSILQTNYSPFLPPLQSSMDVESSEIIPHLEEQQGIDVQFLAQAAETANALKEASEAASRGITPDGSKWWKETGIEQRPDGVVCKWTMIRGVSADKAVEWENKYWEASDDFGYKELGSEKSGRDATGNIWREYWKESMAQNDGVVHLEKTAEKWGKNKQGNEWQEKWLEHYGDGKAEKWADKWCSTDRNTPLDAGHAHVWHERWGETYDGLGGSTKYSDKWAERFEGDGWSRWGDKWDENFDLNSNGVKQGEKWWEGKNGESWNRTWGEGHNGSGWIHKYGKSSGGEHWDTHVQEETWYERFPHYGFYHCFENAVQLRNVKKPSERS